VDTLDLGLAALTSDEAPNASSRTVAGVLAMTAAVVGLAAVKWLSDLTAQRVAGPSGSNPGGVYLGKDGVKRYLKFYEDPAQAAGEQLANRIYEWVGVDAPKSRTYPEATDRGYVFASEILPCEHHLRDVLDGPEGATYARRFLDGFVADVLIGNWDAVGLVHDNAVVLPDGRVVRVDNGGAFLMRAMGGRKPPGLLNDITEYEVFASSRNPSYQAVMRKAGWVDRSGRETPLMKREVASQMDRLRSLTGDDPERLAGLASGLLKETSATAADRARMIEMLKSRYRLLDQRVGAR